MNNPIKGWSVKPQDITLTGKDLKRPECVLAERNGDLWCADIRGGVLCIRADGSQEVVVPKNGGGPFAPNVPEPSLDADEFFSLPNGLCFDEKGDFIICNFGTNRVERLTREGQYRLLLDEIEGKPIGKANFPALDSKGRLWFTVTASLESWRARGSAGSVRNDGYIAMMEHGHARIMATGFRGTNEIRFDENEEWLYVAETGGDHMTRLRVQTDGTLTDREIFGPEKLGGNPDGFAFDSYGNMWVTMITANRLLVITPEREVMTVWEDGDPAVKKPFFELESKTRKNLYKYAPGLLAPRMASITFGGPDLCTVYVGSLVGTSLPTFRSPIPGRALSHWNAGWVK